MSAILHLGAEASPPHYDDLCLTWNPTVSVSDWAEKNSTTLNHILGYSGKLLESPGSFGIIMFS